MISTQPAIGIMGKNNKRRGDELDWDEMSGGRNHESGSVAHNSNGPRGRTGEGYEGGNPQNERNNLRSLDNQGPQTDASLDPYIRVLEDLTARMVDGQKAMKQVQDLYGKQKHDVQHAVKNREQLDESKKRCRQLETTIKTLQSMEEDNRRKFADKIADIEREKKELGRAQNEASDYRRQLEDEKKKFDQRVSITEKEQQVKLSEQRAELEKKQEELYQKRVELLERETKARQDSGRMRMAELEAKNNELAQKLEEQKAKLKQAESRCKDAEALKSLYEERSENLTKELEAAENEFDLNRQTDKF